MRILSGILLTIVLSLTLVPWDAAAQSQGRSGRSTTEQKPLVVEWTNREGASFRGSAEGFDFESKSIRIRGENGQAYLVPTETLSYESKLVMLFTPGLWKDMRAAGKSFRDFFLGFIRANQLFVILYTIIAIVVQTMALWGSAAAVIPGEASHTFGRAFRCSLILCAVYLAFFVAYVLFAVMGPDWIGTLKELAGDPEAALKAIWNNVRIVTFVFAIGWLVVSVFPIASIYEIAFSKAFLMYLTVAFVGAAINFIGGYLLTYLIPTGTSWSEWVLDFFFLKPNGLL